MLFLIRILIKYHEQETLAYQKLFIGMKGMVLMNLQNTTSKS